MIEFLRRSNITGFDLDAFSTRVRGNASAVPNIGIAAAGGGYRALMNGAGFLAAADSRVPGSLDKGGIGGLLQATTYLSALSGGGWLVGSMYANNFSTVTQLRDGSQGSALWAFERNIIQGPETSGLSILNTGRYWDNIIDMVNRKRDGGFNASLTDYWGRGLSYQLINATDGGPAFTFSSIARQPGFRNGEQPLPIILTDERNPGERVIALNSSVVEFNPWEMGSFDPTIYGFTPLQYLGSNFSGGRLANNESCIGGFDQFGFVMGTSSSLFNSVVLYNLTSLGVPEVLTKAINRIFSEIGESENDIAQFQPNPFLGFNPSTNRNAGARQLDLVDGGSDLQNIPLHPLIQPKRALDVVFAIESSADTTSGWPNGASVRATYERSLASIANGSLFPAVPDAETFLNLGLGKRPTFFGCDSRNFTVPSGGRVPPLVVYMPNAPYTFWSNTSTWGTSYSRFDRNGIIQNGYNVATMGNGTVDSTWRTCVGCAVMHRGWERANATVPEVCRQCMQSFCWNGTRDSRPVAYFDQKMMLEHLKPNGARGRWASYGPSPSLVMVALVASTLALIV
jgi:lysophospholipase